MLWITDEIRSDRPTVKDEVSTVLWYLETRLLDAGERARQALLLAFQSEFGDVDRTSSRRRLRCSSATGSGAIATGIPSSRRT